MDSYEACAAEAYIRINMYILWLRHMQVHPSIQRYTCTRGPEGVPAQGRRHTYMGCTSAPLYGTNMNMSICVQAHRTDNYIEMCNDRMATKGCVLTALPQHLSLLPSPRLPWQ